MDGSQSSQHTLVTLYDAGLFSQALQRLMEQAGDVRQWTRPEDRLLGARLMHQLGLGRQGDALLLLARRAAPDHPDVAYYYFRYLLNRRGPLAALQATRNLPPDLFEGSERLGEWLILQGLLYACFRDWDTANSFVSRALEAGPASRWVAVEHAGILLRQDRYHEALSLVEPLARATPTYRPALQSTADLYQLLGRRDDAIDLLAPYVNTMESVPIALQQFSLLMDAQRQEQAEDCLRRARSLVPEHLGKADWQLRVAEYEQAYATNDYAGARAALLGQRHPYFVKILENITINPPSSPRVRLDVPFIRQHHMTCAPATFVAIARYWGYQFDHLDVADQICYDGTAATTERRWVSELGWVVREFELELNVIRKLIDRGIPVAFATVEPGSAHMQAIVGYDLYKGVYLLRDPYQPDIREILIDGAHQAYAASGPRCMAYLPPEKASLITGIEFPALELYDHYYTLQMALEQNRRAEAEAELSVMERSNPGHRLTLWGRRSLACYDADVAVQLEVTDKLLERYPDDLNLMSSRAWALGALGRDEEKRTFLGSTIDSGVHHPLLLQSLADELRIDHRARRQVRHLIERILRQRPTSGQGLFTLACLEWDEQRRDEGTSYYRLASCVEPTNEHFAESYFRSLRWQHQTEQGLSYLKKRVQELGERSANPSVTLALALQSLSRFDEARQVVDTALVRHPSYEWLIKEAIDLYVSCGHFDDALQLLDQSQGYMSELESLRKRAEVARCRGDQDQAAECYRSMLVLNPSHPAAATALAWYINARQGTEAALTLVDECLRSNPHDYTLRGLKVQLLDQLPAWQRYPLLEQLASRFPLDIRVLYSTAQAALIERDFDVASQRVYAALEIDKAAGPCLLLLGDLATQRGQTAQAKEHYRHAISLNVDTEQAFHRLVDACSGFPQRQEALRFIHGELLRQITFGNALLDFSALAPRYLPDAEVRQLLHQAVEQRPDLWQSWASLASFDAGRQNEDQAFKLLSDALIRFPMTPRLWLQRGLLSQQRGELPSAEQDLRQALSINPGWIYAITALADVLEAAQRHDESLELIESALYRYPDEGVLHGYVASLLRRMGRTDQAIESLRAAIRHDPDYDWAWNQLQELTREKPLEQQALAFALQLAERYRHSAALWRRCYLLTDCLDDELHYIQQAIACRPRDPDLAILHCHALLRQGLVKDAREVLQARHWPAGRPSDIWGCEAWLCAHLGNVAEAIAMMSEVVARDPGYADGWRKLAGWYRQIDDRDRARDCARSWLALLPRSANVLVEVAEALLTDATPEDTSLREEAQHYLERALALDGNSEYILLVLLDAYLDAGKLKDAAALLSCREQSFQGALVHVRRIRLALLQEETDIALQYFRQTLSHPDSTHWTVSESLRLLEQGGFRELAASAVTEIATGQDPQAAVGIALAEGWLRQSLPLGKIRKQLTRWRNNMVVWNAIMHVLLSSNYLPTKTRIELAKRYRSVLQENASLRRLVVWLYADTRDWEQVIRWSRASWQRSDNTMDVLYLYGFALRLACKWRQSERVMGKAEGLQDDGVVNSVWVWRAMDLLQRGERDQAHYRLVRINAESLAPIEKYALSVLRQIADMHEIPLNQNVARYQRAFASIRAEFGAMLLEPTALRLRSRWRRIALRTLPASPWVRFWWWWRLRFLC